MYCFVNLFKAKRCMLIFGEKNGLHREPQRRMKLDLTPMDIELQRFLGLGRFEEAPAIVSEHSLDGEDEEAMMIYQH
jgi:hypothetical protein